MRKKALLDYWGGNKKMYRTTRREFLVQGATVMGLFGMAACGQLPNFSGSTSAVPKRGGTLSVGVSQIIEDIDPLTAGLYRWLQFVALSMYEPLVKYDSDGKVIGVLAESWETPDPMTTIFTIRKGVKFHDGSVLTPDDVVNTIQSYNNPKISERSGWPNGYYNDVQKLDDGRVKLTTKKPYQAINNIRWWFVFPRSATKALLAQQPVGTGPFRLKNFTSGTSIEVQRNSEYWQAGQPYLDGITFSFLKDTSVAIANLRAGQINFIHDVPVNVLEQVQSVPGFQLIPTGLFSHWWEPYIFDGPLARREVRLALRYAFDRKRMNQIAWAGKGIDTWNPFDETPLGIHKTIAVSYDPEKAKSLLQAAGSAGVEVPISIVTGSTQGSLEAQVLQQGFEAAGIKTSVTTLDSQTIFRRYYIDRRWSGISENFGTLPFPFANLARYLLSVVLTPSVPSRGSPLAALSDPYDTALSSANESQVTSALKQVQQIMLDEATVYHTFLAHNFQLTPKNLNGLEATKIGDVRFNSAYLA